MSIEEIITLWREGSENVEKLLNERDMRAEKVYNDVCEIVEKKIESYKRSLIAKGLKKKLEELKEFEDEMAQDRGYYLECIYNMC